MYKWTISRFRNKHCGNARVQVKVNNAKGIIITLLHFYINEVSESPHARRRSNSSHDWRKDNDKYVDDSFPKWLFHFWCLKFEIWSFLWGKTTWDNLGQPFPGVGKQDLLGSERVVPCCPMLSSWSVKCGVRSDLLSPGRKFFTLHSSSGTSCKSVLP